MRRFHNGSVSTRTARNVAGQATVLYDKLLFGGQGDKAFSWEKVAPKGPDVGRYQPSRWEVAGMIAGHPKKYPFGFCRS